LGYILCGFANAWPDRELGGKRCTPCSKAAKTQLTGKEKAQKNFPNHTSSETDPLNSAQKGRPNNSQSDSKKLASFRLIV
jgi:hypothetical protein